MKPVRVLVVDDSASARAFIVDILSADSEIQIVGEAENGLEAIKKIPELKPDIVTMDIWMPVMDGLEAIEKIMSSHPVPILVVTSKTDTDTAYKAISKGALEVIPKPDINSGDSEELISKIKLLSKVKVISHIKAGHSGKLISGDLNTSEYNKPDSDKIVAIASSTGGPKALFCLLSALPENFPWPIVIAQHIASDFVSGMAEWLDKVVKLKIKSGEEGESIIGGTVYISRSEKHMVIDRLKKIRFKDREPKDIYFPSCNILLSSVANVYKNRSIGIILTGMGDDGTVGLKDIKTAGGITIAQDENSSVIFGMAKVAIESGCIDKVLPLDKIAGEIISLIKTGC
ncbi:MAG: chemotaxis-specific protein-glutamate methyltransferase CheB [Desulfobacterales bacterium]|nr:chemotaxis-specific protein-glutamate methyltransferase CheB [Desulfobacterales bacterium]